MEEGSPDELKARHERESLEEVFLVMNRKGGGA
jgi:hypothetical protein